MTIFRPSIGPPYSYTASLDLFSRDCLTLPPRRHLPWRCKYLEDTSVAPAQHTTAEEEKPLPRSTFLFRWPPVSYFSDLTDLPSSATTSSSCVVAALPPLGLQTNATESVVRELLKESDQTIHLRYLGSCSLFSSSLDG
ncbi:hypothetical protein BHE74_00020798 [Ensete ventricosum]|nr:hypothetical protein BHE74_00020798 [Ensete ventricosum]